MTVRSQCIHATNGRRAGLRSGNCDDEPEGSFEFEGPGQLEW